MSGIFLMVCNMSVTAVFVIVLVLLARLFLTKAPRSFSYYLWILVAFRLICPYSFSSAVSIFNLDLFGGYMTGNQGMWTGQEELSELLSFGGSGTGGQAADSQAVREEDRMRGTESASGAEDRRRSISETEASSRMEDENGRRSTSGAEGLQNASGEEGAAGISGGLRGAEGETAGLADGGSGRGRAGIEVLTGLWLLGIAGFWGFQIYSYRRLKKSVAMACCYEKGIYECENIEVPFVMGVFRPNIYLPLEITEDERRHILLHEQNHIRRHDYQVKLLAVLLLSVYWFHPLVWLAYHLMCEDMEMSCDERAVQGMSSREKEDYCRTLLKLASRDAGLGRLAAGQPAFGDSSVKHRIKNILDFKSPKKLAVVLGAVLCIFVAFIALANGRQRLQIQCVKPPGTGEIEYKFRLDQDIKSFLIYKEYYRQGEMRSYEVVRAGNLAEAGVDKKGKMSVDVQRHLPEGNVAFMHRFEGEDAYVRNDNSWEMLGYYGYQGMAENYYLENQAQRQDIEAEQEIALAAWHLQAWQEMVEGLPCEAFMDAETKKAALEKNAGEILYYMVFSEKDAEELEAEYAVSPYAKALYEAKNPYIGDAPADARLLERIGVFPDRKRTMELETEEEPYVLRIHFEEPVQEELSFHKKMEKNAILLLCLIENAGGVEWTYPIESGEGQRRFGCDRERAAKLMGLEKTEDMGRFAESRSGVQELLTEYLGFVDPEITANSIGLGVEGAYMSPEGQPYQYSMYVVGRLPGERYDQVFQVLADEEDVTIEDVAEALLEGGASKKMYVLQ